MRRRFARLWSGRRRVDESFAGVEDLLTRYATHRYGPSAQQRDRLRAATLGAFEARISPAVQRPPSHRVSRRFALVFALVALLALGGTAAAAESGPGQPFYRVRLTIESLTLPAEGTARTDAFLAQLQRRLAEASQESDRGNGPGVADAVRAYQETLAEMSGGIGPGVSQTAIEAGLERHVDVLQRIHGSAPANSQRVVQQALNQAERARLAAERRGGGPARPPHPGPPQSPPGRP